ncbi:glutaminyl-peptide cyclotransferase [Aquimarina hainanensis]|uniref:Glutaminyl-peptide cyclotransferase n=1 Tax=Aquimarina hainanensis TaxID=1578017 RepID=A0ABW5NDW6_9FLAO
MKKRNLLALITLNLLLFSCGSNPDKKKNYFSLSLAQKNSKFKAGETIKGSITNKKNIQIDSTSFFLGDTKIESTSNTSFSFKTTDRKLGNHQLKATVYFEGTQQSITKNVIILNKTAPKLYSYEIVATYPHDKNAFVQGLEFYNDTLYESTGRYGSSSLRKIAYTTGEILAKKDISKEYFAEGITILNNKIIQLTWKKRVGFIYDLATLEKKGDFGYNQSKEGWGLCNDGTRIYKSDGTEKIWILDPETLAEKEYIEVTTNKSVKSKFNELEWIEGKIYANTWQKDGIAVINPSNGALEAVIDLSGLRAKVSQHPELDVLNGIAYNKKTKQLFVTGKNWDKLFEIKILK